MSVFVGMNSFVFGHCIGDRVMVDDDPTIIFIVTSIQVYPEGLVYKLSWFDDNGPHDQVFDEFRVAAHPKTRG